MTYNVFSGTLNPTQSIRQTAAFCCLSRSPRQNKTAGYIHARSLTMH